MSISAMPNRQNRYLTFLPAIYYYLSRYIMPFQGSYLVICAIYKIHVYKIQDYVLLTTLN